MKRFSFDTSFDEPGDILPVVDAAPVTVWEPEPAPPEPMFSKDELEAARIAAFADGEAQGRDSVLQGETMRQTALLERLAQLLEQATATRANELAHLEHCAVQAGVAVVKVLYPHSFREETRKEIIHLLRSVLKDRADDNRLVLEASAADAPWLGTVLGKLGGPGLQLKTDPALPPGDCVVTWGDGGIERRQGVIWKRIESLIPKTTQEKPGNE